MIKHLLVGLSSAMLVPAMAVANPPNKTIYDYEHKPLPKSSKKMAPGHSTKATPSSLAGYGSTHSGHSKSINHYPQASSTTVSSAKIGHSGSSPIVKAPASTSTTRKAPVYDAPAFDAPTYNPPTYNAPTYKAPKFSEPNYEKPKPVQPARPHCVVDPCAPTSSVKPASNTHKGPKIDAPTFEGPTFAGPVFEGPTYLPPTYKAPTYAAPVFNAPVFIAPKFEAPKIVNPDGSMTYSHKESGYKVTVPTRECYTYKRKSCSSGAGPIYDSRGRKIK